jgi:bacillithiol biosynthesis cysteine-adding enzyme BshC
MEQIEFGKLNYFSKLFKDFINSSDYITSRFTSNDSNPSQTITTMEGFNSLSDSELNSGSAFLNSRINETFNKRNVLINSIIRSMKNIEFSDEQKNNLEKLKKSKTLGIVTGQQPGFLGGPLYTIFKSISAIIKSNELNEKFSEFNFIPIFWVEDNDHDLEESATAAIYDNNYQPVKVKLDFDSEGIAAYQKLDETISKKLDEIIEKMPRTDLGYDFIRELKNFYKAGYSWSDSFIAYNSYLTKKYGMLFIKSSELSNTGIFKELIIEEISNPGIIKSLVEKASNKLVEKGYHIQANPSDINLFFHKKSLRHKIEFKDNKYYIDDIELSKAEIVEIAEKASENFSPKVLLRPIFQDYVIPTAAYIGGPGEIAYLAQIKEIYEHFDLTMPIINARHSATLIDKSTKRGLDKFNLDAKYFMQNFSIIEKELATELIDEETDYMFMNSGQSIRNILEELTKHIKTIDPQIEKSAVTTLNKIEEQIENLKKKTISLLKRQEEDKFNKYKKMSNMIFPNTIPQERIYSTANFIAQIGLNNFMDYLFQIDEHKANSHFIINLFENITEL